jgi:transcriptional regulator with XRE-family HTH domain
VPDIESDVGEAAARRADLGAFLRSRRERLTPADVGLPSTGRRRTPGLRREELAVLAGISATWYTYLEQGRDVRASDQVLDALGRALQLGDSEREHLHRLAGALPNLESKTAEPHPLGDSARELPGLLGTNPCYITGYDYEVLAWNEAAAAMFPGLIEAERPNLALWIFRDAGSRRVLVDWVDVAQSVLARLRGSVGRHPGDSRLNTLVDDILDSSSEAREWWPRYDIQTSRAGLKRLRHPERGDVVLSHVSFHVADDPEQTMVVYFSPSEGPPASTG